jgi:hypothetical protein
VKILNTVQHQQTANTEENTEESKKTEWRQKRKTEALSTTTKKVKIEEPCDEWKTEVPTTTKIVKIEEPSDERKMEFSSPECYHPIVKAEETDDWSVFIDESEQWENCDLSFQFEDEELQILQL